MAATRSRRFSSRRMRTTVRGETAAAVAACDRFIRTYPESSERRLRVLPEGARLLPRGPGPARLRVRARPLRARAEGDARIVRRVQGARREVPGQPLRAGRDRPDEVPHQRARDSTRSRSRATTTIAAPTSRRSTARRRRSPTIRGRRRTRTRCESWSRATTSSGCRSFATTRSGSSRRRFRKADQWRRGPGGSMGRKIPRAKPDGAKPWWKFW